MSCPTLREYVSVLVNNIYIRECGTDVGARGEKDRKDRTIEEHIEASAVVSRGFPVNMEKVRVNNNRSRTLL